MVKRIRKCLILDDDFGYGRKRVQVIDTETGEMYAEDWKNRPEQGIFPIGVNATVAQTIFTREFAPDKQSEHISIRDRDIEHSYYEFWDKGEHKKPPKKRSTGNKPGYVKLYNEKLAELSAKLSDADLGFLVKLSPLIDWANGALTDKRKKEKLSADDLIRVLKMPERNFYRRMSALTGAGVAYRKNDCYYINRSYMARG